MNPQQSDVLEIPGPGRDLLREDQTVHVGDLDVDPRRNLHRTTPRPEVLEHDRPTVDRWNRSCHQNVDVLVVFECVASSSPRLVPIDRGSEIDSGRRGVEHVDVVNGNPVVVIGRQYRQAEQHERPPADEQRSRSALMDGAKERELNADARMPVDSIIGTRRGPAADAPSLRATRALNEGGPGVARSLRSLTEPASPNDVSTARRAPVQRGRGIGGGDAGGLGIAALGRRSESQGVDQLRREPVIERLEAPGDRGWYTLDADDTTPPGAGAVPGGMLAEWAANQPRATRDCRNGTTWHIGEIAVPATSNDRAFDGSAATPTAVWATSDAGDLEDWNRRTARHRHQARGAVRDALLPHLVADDSVRDHAEESTADRPAEDLTRDDFGTSLRIRPLALSVTT